MIRARLAERLRAIGREGDYAWLAKQVRTPRGQVWKWVTGGTRTFPAAFAAQLEEAGVVSARWLLTEAGSPEPHAPGKAEAKLAALEAVAAGKVDPADVLDLATVDAEDRERFRDMWRRAQQLGQLPPAEPGQTQSEVE